MHDEVTIGARLRALRSWRGMTQSQLADQAGLSTSFISMVEHGHRMLDRRSHISAVAAALRVSEADLTGQPYMTADDGENGPHAKIAAMRRALATNEIGDAVIDRARPLAQLQDIFYGRTTVEVGDGRVTTVPKLRQESNLSALGGLLPDMIDEIHYLVAAADERQRADALRLLIDVLHPAAFVCAVLGSSDLARLAAVQAAEAARYLDDPVYQGVADFMRVMTAPRAGSWDRILKISEDAVNRLEPHVTDEVGIQVYGMLHLTAALAASANSYRMDSANDHLAEAADLAGRLSQGGNAFGMSFNAANVGVWQVMVAAEYGDYPTAVGLARDVDLSPLPANRRCQFHLEVGRSLAHQRGKERQAVMTLKQAEDAAPQRMRNSTVAHETVTYLLGRVRATGLARELRGMASRMGIPH
ncbi:transcriptional regulator [Actinomadura sp. NBRC 104425]|uniref:helix-turn-helix domain-containing protein n=1 Tax=Actinomadura sp. NBRC 104425 TaxID=3032204 RepID=UPI0024A1C884|nr:helix-turn-helix transcriptional regulator [Actinomadura sp. NBRC 104425]GLZ13698.1 transcriptional regulator [Actinomadura sp. NBRC 104425]